MATTNPSRTISAEHCPHNRAAAARLDRAMTAVGMTNARLSERCGLAATTLSRMRRGERWVHARVIEALPSDARLVWTEDEAKEHRARVVRMEPRKCRPVDYLAGMGAVLSTVGQLAQAVTDAWEDRVLTPSEASLIIGIGEQIHARVDALMEPARAARTSGGTNLRAVGVSS